MTYFDQNDTTLIPKVLNLMTWNSFNQPFSLTVLLLSWDRRERIHSEGTTDISLRGKEQWRLCHNQVAIFQGHRLVKLVF